MPTYAYQCPMCDHEFDRILPIAQYKDPQTCPECESHPATKLITTFNFNLPGDDFPGKNNRIKNQMQRKNARLDKKQAEQKRWAPGMTLAPNVDGVRVDSWTEATKLAGSKGKDISGYKKMARKENS